MPRPLYWTHLGKGAVRGQWLQRTPEELRAAWRQHCQHMAEIATARLEEPEFVAELVSHRLDARRVREAPAHLKKIMPLS